MTFVCCPPCKNKRHCKEISGSRISFPRYNRYGKSANARQFPLFIADFDLPDVYLPPDSNGPAHTRDHSALAHAFQMVGVDFESDAGLGAHFAKTKCTGYAAKRFGQRHVGAAVQDSVWLNRFFCDGHRGGEKIVADFGENDVEHFAHCIVIEGIQPFEGGGLIPDF